MFDVANRIVSILMMVPSRESTATLGRNTPKHHDRPENVHDYILEDEVNRDQQKRLIVAVDFGTTYSCISYVALGKGEAPRYLALDRIKSIQEFPNDWTFNSSGDQMTKQVPTELVYPSTADFRKRDDFNTARNDSSDTETDASIPNVANLAVSVAGDDDIDMDDFMLGDSNSLLWGYQVHEAWAIPATHSDPKNRPLSRFKLLLDNSPTTQTIREDLWETLDSLKKKKIITEPLQVIVDFLTYLLRHTKSKFRQEGYDDSWRIEMVLCVPAIWSQKACRDMQTAMAIAMSKAGFKGVDMRNNSIENLFIVSEPEAAAAYVVASEPDIKAGETFVLLDAGGGTVDANTYTISTTTPLRLSREVVTPGGGLFGSSYLNEGFRKVLKNLLDGEDYLENGAETIDGIIEKIMINEFEYRVKRHFDYGTAKGKKAFSVSHLQDNPAKDFRRGYLCIPMRTIGEIFINLLEGIAKVMEDQINKAAQRGCRVTKVLLIGGFSASPSLKRFIKRRLERLSEGLGYRIHAVTPDNTTTAVASGAVLRAFSKEQGPAREARASYGILRTEPFDPENTAEHRGMRPSYDQHDGLPYIKDTIDWILKLGKLVPPVWDCEPFICQHTFDCSARRLQCKEVLYVSDRATKSHYRQKHPMNGGAERIGEIVVDFTSLREQELLRPIEPKENEYGRKIGKRHYRICYTMVIRVVDRDLRCYAIYEDQIVKKCKINIASAFRPGEK